MKTENKMTKTFIGLAFLAAVAGHSTAQANEGQEGHGGQTVRINGVARLRDFVDNTACVLTYAPRFAPSPLYERILESIREVHWYLAAEFEHEARQVEFCPVDAPLPHISTEQSDAQGFTEYRRRTRQVAIRIGNRVLIDMTPRGFPSLSEHDQAFLVYHELTHSFLGSVVDRNRKVLNFIRGLEANFNQRMSVDDFALQIRGNDLDMPQESASWADIRESLQVLMNTHSTSDENRTSVLQILSKIKENEALARSFRLSGWTASRYTTVRRAIDLEWADRRLWGSSYENSASLAQNKYYTYTLREGRPMNDGERSPYQPSDPALCGIQISHVGGEDSHDVTLRWVHCSDGRSWRNKLFYKAVRLSCDRNDCRNAADDHDGDCRDVDLRISQRCQQTIRIEPIAHPAGRPDQVNLSYNVRFDFRSQSPHGKLVDWTTQVIYQTQW